MKILKYLFAIINCFLLFISSGLAQPNAPSSTIVVPRYNGTISLVISWTDNANNETEFQIQRREVGGTFADLISLPTNTITYVDNTATSDKSWEYRVRAVNGAGSSVWSTVPNAMSPRIIWPIPDGDHDILHTYGAPLIFRPNTYLHEGVDISASNVEVEASRGGVVAGTGAGAGGTCNISIDQGAAGTINEGYLHITVDAALGVGDPVAPGDRVGIIRNDYFNRALQADHLHWGVGFNALIGMTNNSDRDPNTTAPVVADINNDGQDFIVVPATENDHNNPRYPAWGEVDFLVDAYDDMAANMDLMSAPFNLGYWIQVSGDGVDVQSNATPYRLIQFDFPLQGSCCPLGWEDNMIYRPLPADIQGLDTWETCLTWRITNTSGTDGSTGNIDANQFWKTDARKGTGTAENGSDAQKAREIQESKYPDGTHFVHIILNDLVNSTDAVRSVEVDNYRPYVKRVTIFSGARIVYQSQWVWNSGSAQLQIQPATLDASANFKALRTQDITIEVEFSEPMNTASITSVAPLGVTPTLTSDQPAHNKTIWRGIISNLDIADDGTDDDTHMISFDGRDLANNALLQINSRANKAANHNNRNAAGNLQGAAGQDNIHGFKIGTLEGVIPVTAIFMKQTMTDPASPTIAEKALDMERALNEFYDEVSYSEISFVVNPVGWYQLSQPLNTYYTNPNTPLIDLVQEALLAAEDDGNDLTDDDYIIIATDETASREEWSTNGGWPYDLDALSAQKLFATGVMNLNSSQARLNNTMGRMIGLVDLFAYPEVTFVGRPFVGPWSIMSDKDLEVHPLGWEKWRAGWLDETGTATGKTLMREAKPPISTPIVNKDFTILPLDNDGDGVKIVAIELADRMHYTIEYRREENLDTDLPEAGVVITKANDAIAQGEGPVILQESPVTTNNLNDAPFTTSPSRDHFEDVGSGVTIDITSITSDQAEIRLNYQVPSTQNDVYVSPHNDRWKAEDIWIDAPDIANNFAADPLSIINANESPVVGKLNKIYGRVRNKGQADATNIEVELEVLEPWGHGTTWRSLKVETVTLLQGQATNPSAYFLIEAEWTPTAGEHTCVKLRSRTVPNDINPENNRTQENITEFVTTSASPFEPVTARFQVENTANERLPVIFRVDGLPPNWTSMITPDRPVMDPGEVRIIQITLQPNDEAPLCTREEITVTPYIPRIDALKPLGAITLQIALKNPAGITSQSYVDCYNIRDEKRAPTFQASPGFSVTQDMVVANDFKPRRICTIITQGCTDPKLPNTQVAVVYTAPDGSTQVRYVTTDENGCFNDIITAPQGGIWEVETVLEEQDCRKEARTPKETVVVVPEFDNGVFDGGVKLYFNFGPNYPLGNLSTIYDPGHSLGVGLMASISNRINILGHFGYHQYYSTSRDNDRILQYGLKIRANLINFGDKDLYAQIGGSQYRPSFTSSKYGLDGTLGLEWPLSAKLALDLGLTYHYIINLQDGEKSSAFIHIPFGVNWKF